LGENCTFHNADLSARGLNSNHLVYRLGEYRYDATGGFVRRSTIHLAANLCCSTASQGAQGSTVRSLVLPQATVRAELSSINGNALFLQ
jgi:hypothetical protein